MRSDDNRFHVALSAIYRSAARKGARRATDTPDDAEAARTLRLIGYLDDAGQVTGEPALIDWRIRLLSVLERCQAYFDFSGGSPGAAADGESGRGAHLVGALLAPSDFGLTTRKTAPVSAGGRGATLRDALEGCACEAAERLSIYDYAPGGPEIMGHGLGDGAPRAAPRAHILKPLSVADDDPPGDPGGGAPRLTSAGCGAGATFDDAVDSGLLELVERDAVALWWRGGMRGGDADDLAPLMKPPFAGADANGVRRWRWFLDLTTDIGAPVIGAVSAQGDGKGVVFAAAAAWDRRAAAAKAAMELAQMELAARLARAKQETTAGPQAAGDRLWLSRLESHDAKAHPIFHPDSARPAPEPACSDRRALLRRLAAGGGGAAAFDLTLPAIGVPCARVVAPGLQQMAAGAPVLPRLASLTGDARATPPPGDWPPPI